MLPVVFLVALGALFCAYKVMLVIRIRATGGGSMPGPNPGWMNGNIGDVVKYGMDGAVTRYAGSYGKIFRMWFGWSPMVVVSDAAEAKRVLHGNDCRGPLVDKLVRVWDSYNLFLFNPPLWQPRRRMMQAAFHQRVLEGLVPAIDSCAQDLVRKLEELTSYGRAEVEMMEMFHRFVLDVVGLTTTGFNFGSIEGHSEAEIEAFATMMRANMLSLSEGIPWWKFYETAAEKERKTALEVLKTSVGSIVEARARAGQDEGECTNVLDILLKARDDTTNAEEQLTDEQIIGEIFAFLAGNDTTGNSLVFLFHLLATHVKTQEHVQVEAEELWERCPHPTIADLDEGLSHLTMTFKESMRLYPVAALLYRGLENDMEVGGYHLKRGTMVCCPSILIHRDPTIYERPEEFNPERFAPEAEEKLPAGAFLPFGGGGRACIGKKLVYIIVQVVASRLLEKFHFRLLPGSAPLTTEYAFSLQPQGGKLSLLVSKW